jgi:cation diffusion facilitator CzcD-associated flavoprotein CzcO
VVIIGSGATAVTLVPNMADKARHVTMLQRSPSYILSVPAQNRLTGLAQKVLPARFAHQLTRQGYIAFQRSLYLASRHFPKTMRKALLGRVRRALGNDFDMRHFTPDYMPWDERLCAVPGGDMFKVLREGKASVVTDHIERFTETGIQLESGKVLDADIIVTATGLKLQMLGGMDLVVDGQPVDVGEQLTYKGVMLEAVPNMSWFFGYTNASWTLKADLAGEYLVRLFSYMDEHDLSVVTAQAGADQRTGNDILESLQSGYIERDRAALPRQGRSGAWKEQMHYGKDKTALLDEPIDDPALSFAPPRSADSVRPWSAAA